MDRAQYDQCNVGATGSLSEKIGVCFSAPGYTPSHFSINIQKSSFQANTAIQYDAGKTYSFTSEQCSYGARSC